MPRRKTIQPETKVTERKPVQADLSKVKAVEEPKKSYGIKDTTELITFLSSVLYATSLAFADGKFHWTEARLFWESLRLAPAAIGGIQNVANEMGELDSDEIKQIESHIIKVLKLPNLNKEAKAKVLIEKSFDTWHVLTNLFKALRI